MTDVFVKVWTESLLRYGLALAVVDRLRQDPAVSLTVIAARGSRAVPAHPNTVWLDRELFWIRAKEAAETLAESDPYVVIDDDHLPIGKTWLEDGVATLARHPEYGMLVSWSVNGEVPEGTGGDDEVFPCADLGTPYFVRKGIIGEFPDGPLGEYDGILTRHLNARGWKTGFMRKVRHLHVGQHYSQMPWMQDA